MLFEVDSRVSKSVENSNDEVSVVVLNEVSYISLLLVVINSKVEISVLVVSIVVKSTSVSIFVCIEVRIVGVDNCSTW